MASFDPFDREFGNRARGLRRTPTVHAWSQLEERLDRRRRGSRILGIRPWLIAAMFLIVAGITIVANMNYDPNNPLAKRAEFMEELSTPYIPGPAEEFAPGNYPDETADDNKVEHDPDFRDVVVADKYRVHG